VIGLKNNSARLPNRKSVDLLIRKRIDVAGLNFQLFMNIYNVLDTRDETNVYTDTGSANYTTTTDPNKIPYNPLRVGTIEEFVLQPGWYSSPREIRAGVSIGF
jgi:outer membrane receptor protein involved in Fe transport